MVSNMYFSNTWVCMWTTKKETEADRRMGGSSGSNIYLGAAVPMISSGCGSGCGSGTVRSHHEDGCGKLGNGRGTDRS